jgi:PAS domain S-box-containing protein
MNDAEIAAFRLAAIVQSSDDAIVSKTVDGTIVSWNRSAERMFGFTEAEAVGKSILIIVPSDRRSEEDMVLARIRRGESVAHYETLRRRKDGSLIPISLTVSPIFGSDGTVIGASKIARDISERHRAEQALADAQARGRHLQNRLVALVAGSGVLFGSPELDAVMTGIISLARGLLPADALAIWRVDQASNRWHIGKAEGVSEAFSEEVVAAHQAGGPGDVPFDDLLIAEDVQSSPLLAKRRQAFRAEGIQSVMAVPLRIGGAAAGSLAFYYRTRRVFDEVDVQTARALGNLSAAAINTALLYDAQRRNREQAERATLQADFLVRASTVLSASLDYETTLRTVAELAVPHIADWCGLDILDDHGQLQRVAIVHIDPEKQELAQRLRERYPEDPQSPYGAHAAIRTGRPILMTEIPDELVRRAAHDAEHLRLIEQLSITSYICTPLIARGRAFGALTLVSAESKRHYDEGDLRLAQEVAYRSALAVDNARAYAQVNAANRAKDEFLATLSHELRTPLNAVLGWARMLRSGTVSPAKTPRALEVIEHNASAQLRLVEDLLDLSRIITGKFRLDVQAVHLGSAIEAAAAAIQPAASAKNITVTIAADAGVGAVQGDPQRLQQAVWNLLSNAVKFTPAGGHVTLDLRADGGQVIVEVTDNGEGIASELLPYVFDRFWQGDSGSTRAHMGLGLGLALVRHIVELHGGRAEVSSAGLGKGAAFRIALPAMAGSSHAISPYRPHPAVQSGGPAIEPGVGRAVAGVRVLVVDDDGDAIELLAELLGQQGLRVRRASSVAEAMVEIERDLPEVIVSDIAMPAHDGYELIQRVNARGTGAGTHIPVIALSAYARAEDKARSLAAGFDAHLAKPVDLRALLNAIVSATSRTPRLTP